MQREGTSKRFIPWPLARRFAVAMLVGGLMGCNSGPKGDSGPAGPPGPPGSAGPTGPRGPATTSLPTPVWRDANNTFAGLPIGRDLVLHYDARGFIWIVDVATGQFRTDDTASTLFDAPDCKGKAYVKGEIPRLVFRLADDPADTFRALPDTFTRVKVQIKSSTDGTNCYNSEEELEVLPIVDTVPATPIVKPSVTFVGPLHLSLQ